MATSAYHLVVIGRVQGVGFRYATCREAQRLGLRGWVRNRRDGSVEAVIAGEAHACLALLNWAQCGPPVARVDAVQQREANKAEIAGLGGAFEQWDDA